MHPIISPVREFYLIFVSYYSNMKKQFFYFLITTILFFSCKKSVEEPIFTTTPTQIVASTLLNIAYGTNVLQKMDVYLPAGRNTTSTPAMIMIHGGAWQFGDKNDMTTYKDSIIKRKPNYAVFNINYRLANAVTLDLFPTQEIDVKAAIDFINARRTEFGISDKFVLFGISAGAHLSLLQAYKYNTPKIKAVVDFFGPTDMVDLYNNPAGPSVPASDVAQLMLGTPTTNPALYASSSPINYVTAQSPATLIFHGGLDNIVRPIQSTRLRDSLIAKAVPRQFVFYSNEGHGWTNQSVVTNSFDNIQSFLTTNVQ
jgi:acetyl esterase/lipase